jgi:hypothetical protein
MITRRGSSNSAIPRLSGTLVMPKTDRVDVLWYCANAGDLFYPVTRVKRFRTGAVLVTIGAVVEFCDEELASPEFISDMGHLVAGFTSMFLENECNWGEIARLLLARLPEAR